MNKTALFNFVADKQNNTIKVERSFDGPLDIVWTAWTDAKILDQWWAPKPWKAVTVSMNFSEGGRWHYYMLGPEGERHYCVFDYSTIKPLKAFSGKDAFCDENQVINTSMPQIKWEYDFVDQKDQTVVNILLRFERLEDLEAIIQMGFKEGFTAGMENLDQYLAARRKS
jgi:uncharacterized protein YndB with AHSA1/START domain